MNNYKAVKVSNHVLGEKDWLDARQGMLRKELCTPEFIEAVKQMPKRADGTPITIGGSFAGYACGVSVYKGRNEALAEKRGNISLVPESDHSALFEMGHINEEHIAHMLEHDLKQKYGEDNVKLFFDKHTYFCGEKKEDGSYRYPWLVLNIDAYVQICKKGEWHTYLVECKSSSAHAHKKHEEWLAGIVPADYEIQTRCYMKGFNVEGTFITCMWSLEDLGKGRTYIFIPRDMKKEENIMSELEMFVAKVKDGTDYKDEDPEKQAQYLCKYFPISKVKKEEAFILDYCPEIEAILDTDKEIEDASLKLAELQKKRDELSCKLVPFFSNNGTSAAQVCLDGQTTLYIDFETAMSRKSIDATAIKTAHPEVYGECLDFSPTLFKKNHKDMVKKYEVAGKPNGTFRIKTTLYNNEVGETIRKGSSEIKVHH